MEKDSGPRAGMRPVRRVSSLRSHSYRILDTVGRGIATRVRRQINDRQLGPMSGANGITKCPFIAGHKARGRLQTDTGAVTASSASGKVKSTVQLAGTGRLVEIEICGLDGNLDRDLMIVGLDGT